MRSDRLRDALGMPSGMKNPEMIETGKKGNERAKEASSACLPTYVRSSILSCLPFALAHNAFLVK